MERKVAVVTGSAKGIGKALIRKFASLNYDVVIVYNTSKNEALELKNNIEYNYKVDVLVAKCDITKEDEIKNIFREVLKKHSKIDVLVNNAAYACDNYIVDKSKEEFMKVLEVNVVGTFLVTKYFYPYLSGGVIVNVSSTDAVDTYSRISMDYCASKAGVNSLTKTFAQEFRNIKVIGVMPYWTNTESIKEMNQEYLECELKRIGQNRLYEPEEVADNIINVINDKNIESGSIVRV